MKRNACIVGNLDKYLETEKFRMIQAKTDLTEPLPILKKIQKINFVPEIQKKNIASRAKNSIDPIPTKDFLKTQVGSMKNLEQIAKK
jgi:hypothetical protein